MHWEQGSCWPLPPNQLAVSVSNQAGGRVPARSEGNVHWQQLGGGWCTERSKGKLVGGFDHMPQRNAAQHSHCFQHSTRCTLQTGCKGATYVDHAQLLQTCARLAPAFEQAQLQLAGCLVES